MFHRAFRTVALPGLLLVLGGCASASPYQGLTPDQLFDMGVRQFQDEDWKDAAETLDQLLLRHPGFSQAAEAQMLLATAYFNDEQYITSQSEFTRFLDRYPAHPSAAEAALGVCRSYVELSPIPQRDQTFTEQALLVCGNIPLDYPGTPEAQEAQRLSDEMRAKLAEKVYESGVYYMDRDFWDSAIIYFEDVVAAYPRTVWAPRALVGIIEAYTEIGYEDEVEAARQRLLEQYPDSPEARAVANGENGGGTHPDSGR